MSHQGPFSKQLKKLGKKREQGIKKAIEYRLENLNQKQLTRVYLTTTASQEDGKGGKYSAKHTVMELLHILQCDMML